MRRKLLAVLVTGLMVGSQWVHADASVRFDRVFALGDSLSDAGYFSTAVQTANPLAPTINYRFTTNNPDGSSRTWVEVLSTKLGINLTPNMIYPTTTGGTDYAQGGAQVATDVVSNGLPVSSVRTQVDRLLATSPSLGANDLVVLWAGANDAFAQFGAVSGGASPVTATVAMATAAQDMVAQVDRLRASGAKYIVVALLPDIGAHTPFGRLAGSFSPGADSLLSAFTSTYNSALAQTLPGRGVVVVNTDKLLADVIANPARYGFAANPLAATSTACGLNPAPTGLSDYFNSSLSCVSTNPGNQLFADGIHPSAQAHVIFGLVANAGLLAIAQAGSLAVAPTVAIRQHALGLEARLQIGALTDGFGKVRNVGDVQVFGGVEGGWFDAKGYQVQPSLSAETQKASVGADRMISGNALVGGVLAYTHGKNTFGNKTGEFVNDVWLGTLYSTVALSKSAYLSASASYGNIDYSRFNRFIELPTTTLTTSATPSGTYRALRLGGGLVYEIGSWKGGPYVALTDDRTRISGFTEADGPASLSFGDQEYHSTRATLGFQASGSAPADAWRPIVRASFDHDTKSSDLVVPMGPDSASLASVYVPRPQRNTWSTSLVMARYGADRSVLSVALSLGGTRDELIGKTVSVGYRVGF